MLTRHVEAALHTQDNLHANRMDALVVALIPLNVSLMRGLKYIQNKRELIAPVCT